ncbi:hypothetical protein [Desulfitobacterium hafniense]|nr:hypothetical protein [Desulfitobacterium hafniense]
MQKKMKHLISLLVILVLTALTIPSMAFAETKVAGQDALDSIDAILERVNAEYGTEIRRFTPEELMQRGIEPKEAAPLTEQQLVELEKRMRHTAETVIPQIELTSQRALEKAKEHGISLDNLKKRHENSLLESFNGLPKRSADSVTPAAALVTATKPINYAIAGASAYIVEDSFGNKKWGNVVRSYCETNIYQPKWFFSASPYSSVIDLGRTIYWTGYGDYGEYINGTQYYIGSGTQYAEMYVGNYI